MKKQHLFTLDINLVRELHNKIGRGHRSQYVEDAIRKKLNNQLEFDIEDITTTQLIMELTYRDDIPKSARTYLMELYREVRK